MNLQFLQLILVSSSLVLISCGKTAGLKPATSPATLSQAAGPNPEGMEASQLAKQPFDSIKRETRPEPLIALASIESLELNSLKPTLFPEGAFRVGIGLFYSNGVSAFCAFQSFEHFTHSTQRATSEGLPSYSALPTGMRNDGYCNYAQGIFLVGSSLFYSNGAGGAYCAFQSWEHFVNVSGSTSLSTVAKFPELPLSMRSDGYCHYPEGLFRVGIGIYWSNGTSAFCGFTSWDHFVRVTGRTSADGIPLYPSLPDNMKNDLACN